MADKRLVLPGLGDPPDTRGVDLRGLASGFIIAGGVVDAVRGFGAAVHEAVRFVDRAVNRAAGVRRDYTQAHEALVRRLHGAGLREGSQLTLDAALRATEASTAKRAARDALAVAQTQTLAGRTLITEGERLRKNIERIIRRISVAVRQSPTVQAAIQALPVFFRNLAGAAGAAFRGDARFAQTAIVSARALASAISGVLRTALLLPAIVGEWMRVVGGAFVSRAALRVEEIAEDVRQSAQGQALERLARETQPMAEQARELERDLPREVRVALRVISFFVIPFERADELRRKSEALREGRISEVFAPRDKAIGQLRVVSRKVRRGALPTPEEVLEIAQEPGVASLLAGLVAHLGVGEMLDRVLEILAGRAIDQGPAPAAIAHLGATTLTTTVAGQVKTAREMVAEEMDRILTGMDALASAFSMAGSALFGALDTIGREGNAVKIARLAFLVSLSYIQAAIELAKAIASLLSEDFASAAAHFLASATYIVSALTAIALGGRDVAGGRASLAKEEERGRAALEGAGAARFVVQVDVEGTWAQGNERATAAVLEAIRGATRGL